MQKLSSEFLASCRRENGRILRGENMTRIETFVDAAFAFAFTMLVISIDEIPKSIPELLLLSQDIPAFVISATVIGSIWIAHSTWSRTFGLQDGVTQCLSLLLVMLVLIFVYPIKLMVQLSVNYISNGALLSEFPILALSEVESLMIYFALGLIALSFILIALYQNALRQREPLVLNEFEIAFCKIACMTWSVVAVTALVSCALTQALQERESISWAGWVYSTLVFTIPLARNNYAKKLDIKNLAGA